MLIVRSINKMKSTDNSDGTTRRNTRQRQVVLEELRKVTSHPTATELYDMARQRLPKISIATVYRNLELLAQAGEITKLDLAGGEARFDGDASQHHHIRCTQCGRVEDAGGPAIQTDVTSPSGYEVTGYRLEFTGVCPDCKNGINRKMPD